MSPAVPRDPRAPLRVLTLIHRFRPVFTGMGLQVEGLAHALAERDVHMTVATAAVPGAPAQEDGIPAVRRFPLAVTRNLAVLAWGSRGFLRFLSRNASTFDVLHIQGAPPIQPLAIRSAQRRGLPVVVTSTLLGSDDPLSIRSRGRLARWRFQAYAGADAFVTISEALRRTYGPAGIPESRVSLIPAGVPARMLDAGRASADDMRRLGWNPEAPRALFVGALLQRKGVDLLLDAWERVLAVLPGARLILVGPDRFPEEPPLDDFARRMRARAEQPPLAGRASVVGRVDDPELLSRMYRAADVFLFPTRMEGFGIVLVEALAAGTPVVVARIPGMTDWNVRNGETGLVVPQEDAGALAAAALRLLSDPGLRARLGAAGREDVRARFTVEAAADAHRALYERLITRRTG